MFLLSNTTPANGQEYPDLLRVGAVNTPFYTGLLDTLLAEFKTQKELDTWICSGKNIYDEARKGTVDMVISHYGKDGTEPFVLEGYGEWPRPVFANQACLIGPESDPANVRGMNDLVEAFRRIAESESPDIVNKSPATRYFTDLLWHAAGKPEKSDWYIVSQSENVSAVEQAKSAGGYVIYGTFPFLRYKEAAKLPMDVMVVGDPILQRIMVSVLIKPDKISGVNYKAAKAFQKFLLSPQAQAMVRAYRVEGSDAQLWWPAARHNNPKVLVEEELTSTERHGQGGAGGGKGNRGAQ